MKRLFQLAVFVLMLTITSTTFAKNPHPERDSVNNGADLTKIETMAISAPNYYQTKISAPTAEQLVNILYEVGQSYKHSNKVQQIRVISYNETINNIRQAIGTEAVYVEQFKEHVGDFSDAYILITVANPNKPNVFFDVYNSKTNAVMYSYQTTLARGYDFKAKNFKTLCKNFYTAFDEAIIDQLSQE